MHPFYVIRALGGVLFIAGYCLMLYNIWMTIAVGEDAEPAVDARLAPAE